MLLLFEFVVDSGFEVIVDAVDESLLRFHIAAFVLPVFDVGIKTVLDHVLGAVQPKFAGNLRPSASFPFDELEQAAIFF